MDQKDISKKVNETIEKGGIFTQRGILGGLYLAAILHLIIIPRLYFSVGKTNENLVDVFPYIGLITTIFSFTVVHLFFEIYVLFSQYTLDYFTVRRFKKEVINHNGSEQKIIRRSSKEHYKYISRIKSELLTDKNIPDKAKTEIEKNLMIRTNLSYINAATIVGFICLISSRFLLKAIPKIDQISIIIVSFILVIGLLAHIRRNIRYGKTIAFWGLKCKEKDIKNFFPFEKKKTRPNI